MALGEFQISGRNAAALFTLKLPRRRMTLLAMNWKDGKPPLDFVGFAIEYKEPGGDRFFALKNRLGFPAPLVRSTQNAPNQICDATKSTEVLVCLSSESRKKVDEMVRTGVAAGGTTYNEPQDHGFMYEHGFQDLDGHIWEIIYMEPSAIGRG